MNHNTFGSIIRRESIILLFAFAVLFTTSCEKKVFNPEYVQSAFGLGLTVQANQNYYSHGDPVEFTLRIVNLTNEKKECFLSTSQQYDIMILDRDSVNVWQYGYRYAFTLAPQLFELQPHQQQVYTTVCQDILSPGTYTTIGWFFIAPALRDTINFVVLSYANYK